MVIAAGHLSGVESQKALASLCEKYWYPLYAYVRRSGHDVSSAQDLVQGFFVHLLGKQSLKEADRERGRFRYFLLASLKHYIANELRAAHAQKRGGGQAPLSLDFEEAERRYLLEYAETLTPEKVFEHNWALALLERALNTLRDHQEQQGKGPVFERLKDYLTSDEPRTPYDGLAAELQMSAGAVRVAVHRLRKHLGELLRGEVVQTLSDPNEVEDEIHHFLTLFSE